MKKWVIAGGESGSSARPAHPGWFRSLRDQCAEADVPFFFKQWGAWAPIASVYPDNFDEDQGPLLARLVEIRNHVALERTGVEAQGATAGVDWCRHQPRPGSWWMERVSRKAIAGRQLDGATHDAFPSDIQQRLREGTNTSTSTSTSTIGRPIGGV